MSPPIHVSLLFGPKEDPPPHAEKWRPPKTHIHTHTHHHHQHNHIFSDLYSVCQSMFIQKCFVSYDNTSFAHKKINHIPQLLNDVLMGPGHSAFMLTCPFMAGCQKSNRQPQHLKASEPESTTNFKPGGLLPLQSTLTSWQWQADLIQTDRGCRKDCQVIKAASPRVSFTLLRGYYYFIYLSFWFLSKPWLQGLCFRRYFFSIFPHCRPCCLLTKGGLLWTSGWLTSLPI